MTIGTVSLLPYLITLSICIQAAIACSHVERTNFWTGETRCCIYVECQPNFYVKECEVDNTADTCEPCPAGSFMFDRTDSHFPFQCRRYSCPPEARPKSTFSEKGCKLPCECDESRGYIGEDPCLCRKRARSFLLQTLHRKWWKHSFAKPTVWSASNHTQMCSIDINLKLYACTYLCIELLDVFVFILKNKMAFFLL